MDNKPPANACRRCGATAYKPVIARDASGAMTPSGAYRCVRCKVEFTSIDQWRSAAGSAYTASSLIQGLQPTA
jgi:ribosomal protein L40E